MMIVWGTFSVNIIFEVRAKATASNVYTVNVNPTKNRTIFESDFGSKIHTRLLPRVRCEWFRITLVHRDVGPV